MRRAVREHLIAVANGLGGQACRLVYNAVAGAPPCWLRRFAPRVVALHTTFLAQRWLASFQRWRERSEWIAEVGVPTLAFPQDESRRSCSRRMACRTRDDRRLHGASASHRHPLPDPGWSCLPSDPHGVHRPPPPILGYLIRVPSTWPTWATRLPFWFGRIGQLKATLAIETLRQARVLHLRSDVSVDPGSQLSGERWIRRSTSAQATVVLRERFNCA